MVASNETVAAIIEVLLEYMDRDQAHQLARDLYGKVKASKSVTDTFRRIAERLEQEG